MALCDRTSELNYARDKGFEKGRKKGRKEERQRLLELLDQGLSPEEIKRRLK
jgi:acetyl-CoA carboxylase carboxyltransferase component